MLELIYYLIAAIYEHLNDARPKKITIFVEEILHLINDLARIMPNAEHGRRGHAWLAIERV